MIGIIVGISFFIGSMFGMILWNYLEHKHKAKHYAHGVPKSRITTWVPEPLHTAKELTMLEHEVYNATIICKTAREFEQMWVGVRLYNALSWRHSAHTNLESIITSDKGTRDILVDEGGLMKLIQLICPAQAERKIRLISSDDMAEIRRHRV